MVNSVCVGNGEQYQADHNRSFYDVVVCSRLPLTFVVLDVVGRKVFVGIVFLAVNDAALVHDFPLMNFDMKNIIPVWRAASWQKGRFANCTCLSTVFD